MAKTKVKGKAASRTAKKIVAKANAVIKKAAGKLKPKAKAKAASKPARKPAASPGWVDAGKGYELGIRDGKLVARKDGKECSVPKPLKEGPVGERLLAAIDFLDDHELTCRNTVETWMLRSLPVPRGILENVLADESWQKVLNDAFVVPVAADGTVDRESGGFFRAASDKGIGVVDRSGETTWIDASVVMVPHPILLDEIDDLRQMAVEIGAKQGLSQLFRETFQKPATTPDDPASIHKYAGGEFNALATAISIAKRLGYRVTGGNAVCRVLESGRFVEARYELGDGDPMYETTTGDLTWVDDKQRTLDIKDVPPIAYSEGMRMAELIYAKRKIEKEGDDDN